MMGRYMVIMTKEELEFARDWFTERLREDSNHNEEICLDCQANGIALLVISSRLRELKERNL